MDTGQLAAVSGSGAVHRSFAFIDLSGFTDFADERGDDDARDELRHLRAAVREVVPLFGVRVEKWLGDGCMLVGVDNEPLVSAVVALQERHRFEGCLPLRAGIACGDVLLLEGDDYVGRAVNLASRLCDAAADAQVLASRAGLELPSWITVAESLTVSVRGFAMAVPVARLELVAAELTQHRNSGPWQYVLDGLTKTLRRAV